MPNYTAAGCMAPTTGRFGALTAPYSPTADPYFAANAAKDMGANVYWAAGYGGQGVDIALIDTGVAPVGDLKDVVIDGPDFSLESQNSALAHNDSYGHGTAMASIMHAAAPQARILSVKVGVSDGAVDLTQVKAAIDWVREHRNAYGLHISVMNLSYGIVSWNDWTRDPLSKSVDQSWADGITVLAADGNNGDLAFDDPAAGLESPSFNQNVIAVGAIDSGTVVADSGSTSRYSDDKLATFSASSSRTNPRLPDIGAPGSHIVVNRVPNAAADNMVADDMCVVTDPITGALTTYPVLGGGKYIKSSGTSEATAMATGAVALMQSRSAALKTSPDSVKRMLKANAHSVPNGAKSVYGDGAIDLKAVYGASIPSYSQNHDTVVGGGISEAARGGFHLLDPAGVKYWTLLAPNCVDTSGLASFTAIEPEGAWLCANYDIFGKTVNGELDSYVGQDHTWTDTALGSVYAGDGVAWVAPPATPAQGGDANGFLTDPVFGKVWPTAAWPHSWSIPGVSVSSAWASFAPSGVSWTGTGWSSAQSWRSPDGSFTGHTWRGNRWSGNRWSGNRWSGNRWSGNSWREYSYS
jgi:serine protease AprX